MSLEDDPIIEKYLEQIQKMQTEIDRLMAIPDSGESTLNEIGFHIEAIKTHLESMAIYQDIRYGL